MSHRDRKTFSIGRIVETVIVYKILHILYFLGGLVAGYAGPILILSWLSPRGAWTSGYLAAAILTSPWFHVAAFAFAVLCCLFGPYLYRASVMRGRGELAKIRSTSAQKVTHDKPWEPVADDTGFQEWRSQLTNKATATPETTPDND